VFEVLEAVLKATKWRNVIARRIALVMLTAVGFALRVGGISRLGLTEDEVNKLEAVRAYERGDFTQNAEGVCGATRGAAERWPRRRPRGRRR